MAEASPIGRGKNLTLETILTLLDAIPFESMQKNKFLAFGEIRMKGWRQTHSQIARQLALYYEDEHGICHPRFTQKITPEEAANYGCNWARKYFAPNPFTPSLSQFKGKETNIYAFVHQNVLDGETSFNRICQKLFDIELNNLDKVRVYLSNFTDLIISEDNVAINDSVSNSKGLEIYPSINSDSTTDYFHHFDTNISSKDKIYSLKPIQPLQQIFYGAPGTGKSFTIDDTVNDDNSVRITFHPDSDYASFVGAYKPTMEAVPINSIYGESVQFATGKNGHPGTEKKIVYKYVPQAFLKAYVAAWSNLDKPYFLVIEEINRGNCAQIFGDLFQLLDRNNAGSSSYAIHADQDIAQFLRDDKENGFAGLDNEQRDAIAHFILEKDNGKTENIGADIFNGTKLLLPPNLFIWATMNTSDQSLFPIDSAFKRRWNWKYMPIEYAPIDKKTSNPIEWKVEIAGALYSWGAFLAKINPEIYTLTESSDKQMGYFFAKADPKTGIISEDVFLNKVLFYLWTDVFKDYDVSSDYFYNKKQNRSFRFTDFFEDKEALGNFIDNFGLVPVEDTVIGEIQNEQDGITDTPSSKRKKHFLVWTDKEGNQNKDPLYSGYFKFVKNLVDKFGEDKVADIINSYGITRHKGEVMLMDTKTYPNLNVAYTQRPLGKYYLLLGVNQTTAIAKRLNESFNLGLSIEEIAE